MPAIPSPGLDGFAVTDRFASASLLSSYALGEETLRASFTENGKEGEGMFAASVWTSEALILPQDCR